MFKRLLLPSLCALVLFVPSLCAAQTKTVALFAPSLDFKDGGARNQYVTRVAKILADKTGLKWEGNAYARASDFESARAQSDVAIVDAEYFSYKSGGMRPVGMLSANGTNVRRLKVVAKKGSSEQLYTYRGKRLALVSSTPLSKSFFTSSVLGNEAKVDSYFSSIDEVRDVRSAINAIEMGKADLALVYDGYESGLTTVFTTPPVGLPVIAVNATRLTGPQFEQVKDAILSINAQASEFVTGATAYNAIDAAAFRRIANEKKAMTLSYQPMEHELAKISVSAAVLTERKEGILFNPFQVVYVPTLSELDKKLELRL